MFTWLVASDDELEAAQLREACASAGVARIADAGRGEVLDFYGRIQAVSYIPIDDQVPSPAVEVQLFDGSGVITLLWLGRSVIAGIVAGRLLRVRGRMALRDGRAVVYNPRYSLEGK